MSYSLTYCQKIIADPTKFKLCNNNYDKIVEKSTEDFLTYVDLITPKQINLNELRFGFDLSRILNLPPQEITVSFKHDPNADFQHFTYSSCVSDGSGVFKESTIKDLLYYVLNFKRIYPEVCAEFKDKDVVHVILGNLVAIHEYDESLATEERPFLRNKTTVLLPFRVDIIRGE